MADLLGVEISTRFKNVLTIVSIVAVISAVLLSVTSRLVN